MELDTLASLAAQLVARVRDDDAERNAEWLARQLPDPADWFRLCFALAAAVPTDVSWLVLTNWTVSRGGVSARPLKPHGTSGAVGRHRYRNENLCDLCKAFERERRRRSRAA